VIPKVRGYRFRQEVLQLDDGANTHRLVKVPVAELAEWDTTHDHTGRLLSHGSIQNSKEEKKVAEEGVP